MQQPNKSNKPIQSRLTQDLKKNIFSIPAK